MLEQLATICLIRTPQNYQLIKTIDQVKKMTQSMEMVCHTKVKIQNEFLEPK